MTRPLLIVSSLVLISCQEKTHEATTDVSTPPPQPAPKEKVQLTVLDRVKSLAKKKELVQEDIEKLFPEAKRQKGLSYDQYVINGFFTLFLERKFPVAIAIPEPGAFEEERPTGVILEIDPKLPKISINPGDFEAEATGTQYSSFILKDKNSKVIFNSEP